MRSFLLLALFSVLAPACTNFRAAPERLDRHGQRQGRTRIYYDEAHTRIFTKGRYRHGQAVGRWRYFNQAGALQHQERYRRHGISEVAYYYPTGRVARRGHARTVDEPDGAHFYWFGDWQFYSPAGALDSIRVYELGHSVRTKRFAAKEKAADR